MPRLRQLVWLLLAPGPLLAQRATSDTLSYTVLLASRPAGVHRAWTSADGTRNFTLEYNDRGRGPSLRQQVELSPEGFPLRLTITGHDYLKSPVDERYTLHRDGSAWRAAWKNQAESTSVRVDRSAYYLPLNDASSGLLEALLLASPDSTLTVLPHAKLRVERVRDLNVAAEGRSARLTLFATHGIGFTPATWWADERGRFFAAGSSWTMTIRQGWEPAVAALLRAQASYDSARAITAARTLTRRPSGPVVFRNATLFDPESGRTRPRTTIVVRGNRIAAVGAEGTVPIPDGAEVIDVAGRTVMPGMWDMHVHMTEDEGLLHLAAGVTTVRDMANDMDETLARRRRIAEGTLLGPRMHLAGFLDGPGPFAGPTKALVSTADSARAWVNRYADAGHVQVKIYSSIDPALVPVIVSAAHARGMRVSGHVPQGMTAEEFVRAGADELQHVNFLFLNFWRDSVKDTRTPERFTAPAARAALLPLDDERVRRFVRLLKERGTVIDPTLVAFEGMLTARPGTLDPTFASVADRMPPALRRYFMGGGLPVPDSLERRYRESYAAFKRMVKTMFDAGVPIVAGTDNLAGFAYHRELELYAEAGIPHADILRMATLGAAQVMKQERDLGSIAAGKLADLIVIDGDPLRRISDIRRVTLVMKDGSLHDPAALYRAVGVTPAVP